MREVNVCEITPDFVQQCERISQSWDKGLYAILGNGLMLGNEARVRRTEPHYYLLTIAPIGCDHNLNWQVTYMDGTFSAADMIDRMMKLAPLASWKPLGIESDEIEVHPSKSFPGSWEVWHKTSAYYHRTKREAEGAKKEIVRRGYF